jgi:5-methylcytosine-specific restriction protein A
MDEESLKAAARLRSGNSKTEREVVVKQIVRDPYISEYAKLRAKGVCQLCGEDAPFKDSKGRPYLESHHIIWLANGGEDSIENTVALCPNCHRKMHIVMDEKDVETLKNITRE